MFTRLMRALGLGRAVQLVLQEDHDPATGACSLYGDHEWQSSKEQPYKRKCRGCGSEEWLFTKQCPAIGKAKHNWRNMDTRNLTDL